MRFHVNGAKAYFIGCTLLTWALTACAGGALPTDTLTPTYEVIAPPNGLGQGMVRSRILDKNGHLVYDETYEAKSAAARSASMAEGMSLTPLDSMNIHALTVLLARGTTGQPITFQLGGKEFAIQVLQRGANGGAKSFAILLSGDTSVVLRSAANGAANQQIEVHAGDEILYTSTTEAGPALPSQGAIISVLSEECLGMVTMAGSEFAAGITAIYIALQEGQTTTTILVAMGGAVAAFYALVNQIGIASESCGEEFDDLIRNGLGVCELPLISELFCQS